MLREVETRLDSVNDDCAADLAAALEAMANGDLTHVVTPVTTLIGTRSGDAAAAALAEKMNALAVKIQGCAAACNGVRAGIGAVLGDHPGRQAVQTRLDSLTRHPPRRADRRPGQARGRGAGGHPGRRRRRDPRDGPGLAAASGEMSAIAQETGSSSDGIAELTVGVAEGLGARTR